MSLPKHIAVVLAASLLGIGPAMANSGLVSTTADSGVGSLRYMITNTPAGGTIGFASNLAGATIVLTNGELLLNQNVTIDASALPGGVIINGNASNRIFEVDNGQTTVTTVILSSLTITNGAMTSEGGGIYSGGTLIMNQCIVAGNSATYEGSGSGGGIYQYEGNLTMNQCTVSGNSAVNSGGAIYSLGISLTLNDCTLSGNSVGEGFGGGICTSFTSNTINQCTIANNSTGSGGEGGAIYDNYGSLVLYQCTVTGNSSLSECGGIYTQDSVSLSNCIVAGNSAPFSGADIFAFNNIFYGGSNLVQSTTYAGSYGPAPIVGGANLMPLGNYGGPTLTMPPLPGSPALNAGSDSATNMFPTDQRGLPRLSGPHVDIGAVEAQYSTLVVSNTADSGAGSLRDAIGEAATYFASVTFASNLAGQTIGLTSGELLLNKDLTIDGSALAQPVQISGSHQSRVFDVASGWLVQLTGLTITGGSAPAGFSGGGIINSGTLELYDCLVTGNSINALSANAAGGGGIYNANTMSLTGCVVSNNLVANPSTNDANGGGVLNSGNLGLNYCVFVGNVVSNRMGGNANGGALYNLPAGTAFFSDCTVTANSAFDDCYTFNANGGGIYNAGMLTLLNSTVSSNIASAGALSFANGGGIANDGNLTVNQCTLSGNLSSDVGGCFFVGGGTVNLNQSTVSANSASANGGAGGGLFLEGGSFNLYNSILGGNSQGVDSDAYIYSGILNPSGENLIDDVPLLAALGNYGGNTETMPPLPGSPAIDGCTNGTPFETDQRGFARLSGGLTDIGAVESGLTPVGSIFLTKVTKLASGTLSFGFTNITGTSFTVLASTNVALPLSKWANLGPAVESPVGSGNFQFSDTQAPNFPQRFYLVESP